MKTEWQSTIPEKIEKIMQDKKLRTSLEDKLPLQDNEIGILIKWNKLTKEFNAFIDGVSIGSEGIAVLMDTVKEALVAKVKDEELEEDGENIGDKPPWLN